MTLEVAGRTGTVGPQITAAESSRLRGDLPEAMRNYLLRLSWSHGDDEIIPTERAIEWFDFSGIGRSAARFDLKKLDSLNAHYMREMSDGALADEVITFAQRKSPGRTFDTEARARLTAMMPLLTRLMMAIVAPCY